MKARIRLSTLLAFAAAAALLALGGPGVTAARADASERRVPLEIGGDGASCRAGGSDDLTASRAGTADAMERLQATLRAELEAGAGGEAVVLNGRGYNYGRDERPDLSRELQILLRDAKRQRAR